MGPNISSTSSGAAALGMKTMLRACPSGFITSLSLLCLNDSGSVVGDGCGYAFIILPDDLLTLVVCHAWTMSEGIYSLVVSEIVCYGSSKMSD